MDSPVYSLIIFGLGVIFLVLNAVVYLLIGNMFSLFVAGGLCVVLGFAGPMMLDSIRQLGKRDGS